jgi:hypothetical protein
LQLVARPKRAQLYERSDGRNGNDEEGTKSRDKVPGLK